MRIVRDTAERPRIALYSHDTMGLGHSRRNLLIARTLTAPPTNASVLMISGIRQAGAFAAPPGVDFLTLPAYHKDRTGTYQARSLALSAAALAKLRGEIIRAALENFAPDVFIVDNVPRGALDELIPGLDLLVRKGRTRCILGLRDVIDSPSTVSRQWLQRRNFEAVRKYYDAVWIYGDPAVYDTATEYDFPSELRRKTRYTGYLDPQHRDRAPGALCGATSSCPEGAPYVLCAVGGGQDGADLARAFSLATRPHGMRGVIVTGPFMPDNEREWLTRHAAASGGQLTVMGFVPEPLELMLHAQAIVAMGGYNTVSEILSMGKHALIVPRCTPRKEQLIRAERLKAMGHIDYIRAETLTEGGISAWLGAPAKAGPRTAIDFGGLDRIPDFLAELIETPHAAATVCVPPPIQRNEEVPLAAV